MSARRRRAALSALGALLAALFCAALAGSVAERGRQLILAALVVAWLAVAVSCLINALRSDRPADPGPPIDLTAPPGPPPAEVGSDEPA